MESTKPQKNSISITSFERESIKVDSNGARRKKDKDKKNVLVFYEVFIYFNAVRVNTST